MQLRLTQWLAIGTAAVAIACTTQQPVVTTTSRPTTTTSSGDVVLSSSVGGWWADSVGGTWIDTTGAMWMGGRGGMSVGLQPADISALNNANIFAHIETGDSLEVALSQLGVEHAQNTAARDFARRMVIEHSAHLQMSRQMATQAGIVPVTAPGDTADAAMVPRMMTRLSRDFGSPGFDRQFMRSEVTIHQHLLHDLDMARPQATGAALQLVDQTIPVVKQHLADAQAIWRQVGGGMNASYRTP
jgi:predicted outer membrane protein